MKHTAPNYLKALRCNRLPKENFYFFGLLGLRAGVLPGVFLLSRRRWSGLPVDLAIGFGPGLSDMTNLHLAFVTHGNLQWIPL